MGFKLVHDSHLVSSYVQENNGALLVAHGHQILVSDARTCFDLSDGFILGKVAGVLASVEIPFENVAFYVTAN